MADMSLRPIRPRFRRRVALDVPERLIADVVPVIGTLTLAYSSFESVQSLLPPNATLPAGVVTMFCRLSS
jgi:hypothetical protein